MCAEDTFKRIEAIRIKVQFRTDSRAKYAESANTACNYVVQGIPRESNRNVRRCPDGVMVAADVPAHLIGRY